MTRGKNNLLSAVLLVTVFPSEVQISQATLEHLCNLLLSLSAQKESQVSTLFLRTMQHTDPAASSSNYQPFSAFAPSSLPHLAKAQRRCSACLCWHPL